MIHKKHIKVTISILVIIIALLYIPKTFATTGIVYLDDNNDSYCDEDNPATNYGTNTQLYIRAGLFVGERYGFIDFNFEDLPICTITNVTLTMYQTDQPTTNVNLRIHRVLSSWDESTITWNDMPSTGSYVDFEITGHANGWHDFNITDIATDTTGLHGFRIGFSTISGASSSTVHYGTKELTDYEPYLTIYCDFSRDIGTTVVTLLGDGAQVTGGSEFDVMATNSSHEDGESSARVDTYMYNLQHMHVAVSLWQNATWNSTSSDWSCPSYHNNTGYLEYGIGYFDQNGNVSIPGWKVHIEIEDGNVGNSPDSNWVELSCAWYNNYDLVKTDTIYAGYEAYAENESTTQLSLYVDLWLSEESGSTRVGGSVSSKYYGMESGGWWLWTNWTPKGGLEAISTFYDDFYDENGAAISTGDMANYSIFYGWTKLAKIAEGETGLSESCDEHMWATQCTAIQFITLPYGATLTGIETPVLMPTTTPDMPLGFFASLGNVLSQALDTISYQLSLVSSAAYGATTSTVDAAFSSIGISDFVSNITSHINNLASYFTVSITYIGNLILHIFTLFASIITTVIEWFGRIVTTLISILDTMWGIINGTIAATEGVTEAAQYLTELWTTDGATTFIPLLMIIWWWVSIDKRAKRLGGGWMGIFMSDINNIMSILSFILDLAFRIINTILDIITRFFGIFGLGL